MKYVSKKKTARQLFVEKACQKPEFIVVKRINGKTKLSPTGSHKEKSSWVPHGRLLERTNKEKWFYNN